MKTTKKDLVFILLLSYFAIAGIVLHVNIILELINLIKF